jgi:hypothetical protein
MSLPFSQRSPLRPEESISQVNYDIQDDKDDIYENPSREEGSSMLGTSSSSIARLPKSHRNWGSEETVFHVNQDVVNDAAVFLKVLPPQNIVTNIKAPYIGFIWRFQVDKPRKSYWNDFYECVDRTKGEPKVQCKHCRKLLSHPRRNKEGTTSGMSDHLKICAAYQLDIAQAHSKSGDIRSLFQGVNMKAASGDRVPKNITQELVEERILKFFVSGNIPFK